MDTSKILILGIILLLLFLYFHSILQKKADTFADITPQPISIQLTDQISKILGVSSRRIQNLSFNGDISNQSLTVTFTILDPNIIEISKKEPNAQTAAQNANDLFNRNEFVVKLTDNNKTLNVKLLKIQSSSNSDSLDYKIFFDNTGLQQIIDYAKQTYSQTPDEASLTKYYHLDIDSNYNVQPVL